jgi:flagellar protein FlaG
MINAVSGLPAIVVDTFEELKAELERDSMMEFVKENDNKIIISNEVRQKESDKDLNNQSIKSASPNYEQLAEKLKSILNENDMTLEFRLDQDTNEMILKIIDSDTQEVIRQLPPELTLKIAKFVANMLGTGQVTNARV